VSVKLYGYFFNFCHELFELMRIGPGARYAIVGLFIGIMATGLFAWFIGMKQKTAIQEVGSTASIVENGIRLMISVEKVVFKSGEMIEVSLSMKNERAENVTLGLPYFNIKFILAVYNENFEQVLTRPIIGLPMVGEITLKPGESYSEILSWDQTAREPDTDVYRLVNPGRYYLQGVFYGKTLMTPQLLVTIG